ncbi:MAG: RDD family protein [Actinomycetota bacterium]|nr:RDD family protein [Actinomycetota bacterium]
MPADSDRTPLGRALPAPGWLRLRASGADYVVIVGWLAILTAAGFAIRPLLPPQSGALSPVAADAVAFLFSVLPVWVYLSVTEGGALQATWGKRWTRLRVIAADGGEPGPGRAVIRNAVKLLPWELAHLAVARLILGVDQQVTIGVTYALSVLIPVVSVVMMARDPLRRALHDRVAGTRVVR